jgi:hypothetical protein
VVEVAAPPDANLAFLQPPWWRPLQELLVGVPRLFAAKWCVPGDVKTAGDGGSFPVERTKVVIAFHVLFSGSFVQLSRTML